MEACVRNRKPQPSAQLWLVPRLLLDAGADEAALVRLERQVEHRESVACGSWHGNPGRVIDLEAVAGFVGRTARAALRNGLVALINSVGPVAGDCDRKSPSANERQGNPRGQDCSEKQRKKSCGTLTVVDVTGRTRRQRRDGKRAGLGGNRAGLAGPGRTVRRRPRRRRRLHTKGPHDLP